MQPAVTWRSVLIGLLLLPFNAYWLVQMERVRYSAHPTTISLFFNLVFIILILALLNAAVHRLRRRWALTQGELLVIWVMLAIGSCMAGHDWFQVLVPMLSWPYRFAGIGNRWDTLFMDDIPHWLMVTDSAVFRGYYEGNTNLYQPFILKGWLKAALWWCAFTVALLWVMLCLCALIRQQWTKRERLTYPLTQLPMELTADGGRSLFQTLFCRKALWAGFLFASTVDTLNSLHLYYPAVPSFLYPGGGVAFLNVQPIWFPNRPFSAIGWTPVSWYPFAIGLGMMMPLDFLFSCWFFYLFWKIELVICAAFGWDAKPRFPYTNYQAFGAYMAFLLYSLWVGRGYISEVISKALGLRSSLDDSGEPLRYRFALLGAIGGLSFLIWFSWKAGMRVPIAIAFFAYYYLLSVAISRMRAEGGTPVHDLHFTGADWTFPEIFGTRAFPKSELIVFSLYFWFNRAYRCHPMPHMLEGFKMAELTKSSQRRWFWLMALASVVGTLTAFWAMLHLMYDYGAVAKSRGTFGPEAYNRLAGWLNQPLHPNKDLVIATFIGLCIALFFQKMRLTFVWWPFHPLAFAVTSSWEINLVWLPLFIAWLLKVVTLKYAGFGGFKATLPFFYGLILGQFTVGSILNIIGIILDIPTYQFWQ